MTRAIRPDQAEAMWQTAKKEQDDHTKKRAIELINTALAHNERTFWHGFWEHGSDGDHAIMHRFFINKEVLDDVFDEYRDAGWSITRKEEYYTFTPQPEGWYYGD